MKANIWLRPSHLGRVNRPAFGTTLPTSDVLLPDSTTPHIYDEMLTLLIWWSSCLSLSCVWTSQHPLCLAAVWSYKCMSFPPPPHQLAPTRPWALLEVAAWGIRSFSGPKYPTHSMHPCCPQARVFCACVYHPRYIFISGLPERANKSPQTHKYAFTNSALKQGEFTSTPSFASSSGYTAANKQTL